MSMLVYEDTDIFKFLPQMQELFALHFDELCVTKEHPFDPDYDAYRRLAEAGMLRCIVCRVDQTVIGYALFVVQPSRHQKGCLTAYEDMYFVRKEWRRGRIGVKLFQYAESVLKQVGVQRIVMCTKVHKDNSRLLEYLKYRWTDKMFSKALGGAL